MQAPDLEWARPPDRGRTGRDSPPTGLDAIPSPMAGTRRRPILHGWDEIRRPLLHGWVGGDHREALQLQRRGPSSRPEEDAPLVSPAYAQGSCYATNRVVTDAPGRPAGPAAPPPSTAEEAESTNGTLRRPRSSRRTNWARIPEEPGAAGSSRTWDRGRLCAVLVATTRRAMRRKHPGGRGQPGVATDGAPNAPVIASRMRSTIAATIAISRSSPGQSDGPR